MTVQLTPAQEQRLSCLAAETHRSLDDLAQESMDRYLAYEEDLLATVERGRVDIAAGRLVGHEEVMGHLDACKRKVKIIWTVGAVDDLTAI